VRGQTLSLSRFSLEVVNNAVGPGVPDETLYELVIRWTPRDRNHDMPMDSPQAQVANHSDRARRRKRRTQPRVPAEDDPRVPIRTERVVHWT